MSERSAKMIDGGEKCKMSVGFISTGKLRSSVGSDVELKT